jgi:hypothetical protein
MTDVQIYKVDEKLAPDSVWAWMVKFGNHGNHTILVWQLNPYVYVKQWVL